MLMPRNRANSLCVPALQPSAMLNTMDSAARIICDCSDE